ncbi:hypothetical protein BDW42DRAFT_167127 [Aspergillus taichungensis]|uniref:Uncharacterized protein n=1 Tax=Aspergillus taichungensis TaxID=482145 RepID=A0A2J5HY69_9EURO|nr:hypothetical protein BDW42DRAFT_167127 [Aspergillus taichungensis]
MSPTSHPAILRQPGGRMTDLRRNASLTHALFRFHSTFVTTVRHSTDEQNDPFFYIQPLYLLWFLIPQFCCADLLGFISCVYFFHCSFNTVHGWASCLDNKACPSFYMFFSFFFFFLIFPSLVPLFS